VPMLHSLCAAATRVAPPAAAAAAQLAALPVTFIWAAAVLFFGILLMVCVLLLLRRESAPLYPLESGPGLRGRRGQYLQHLSRLLRSIRTINSLILTERDRQQLLEKACLSLTTTRGYRMAWVGLVEEGTKKVRPVAQAGFANGYLDQVEITWDDTATGQGPTGRAIKASAPAVMRDIEAAPEYEPWRRQALERGYRSSAAVPLRFRGGVLGTLNVYAEIADAFDIEEVGLLQEVADHLAYALGSFNLESELTAAREQLQQVELVCAGFYRAPVGILVTDNEGTIKSVNGRMIEILDGFKGPEELVGRVRLSKLPMFSTSGARNRIRQVLEGGRAVEFECRPPAAGAGTSGRILRCRGVPVVSDGHELTGAIWSVEDAAPPSAESGGGVPDPDAGFGDRPE